MLKNIFIKIKKNVCISRLYILFSIGLVVAYVVLAFINSHIYKSEIELDEYLFLGFLLILILGAGFVLLAISAVITKFTKRKAINFILITLLILNEVINFVPVHLRVKKFVIQERVAGENYSFQPTIWPLEIYWIDSYVIETRSGRTPGMYRKTQEGMDIYLKGVTRFLRSRISLLNFIENHMFGSFIDTRPAGFYFNTDFINILEPKVINIYYRDMADSYRVQRLSSGELIVEPIKATFTQ